MKQKMIRKHPDEPFYANGKTEVCYLQDDGVTVVFKYKKGRRQKVPIHEIKP